MYLHVQKTDQRRDDHLQVRGLVYKGTRRVAVDEVPDVKVVDATAAVIKLTTSNICGSDLHTYAGPDPDRFLQFFVDDLQAPLRALTPNGR